ncbi:hypothetical protein AB4Y89_23735 [Terriglobus sp. 2YAB30_2]|uniref:hypothetical protein n=1 Tax=unclassified Terriglobus TaxID=2628988 RepID=UPI003F955BBF
MTENTKTPATQNSNDNVSVTGFGSGNGGNGGNGAVTQANSSSTQSLFDTVHQIQMIAGGLLATDNFGPTIGNSLQAIFMGCRSIYVGCSSSTLSLNDGVGQIQDLAFSLNNLPEVFSSKDGSGGVELITGACNDILGGEPSAQSWIGGPQNGNETPGEAKKTLQEKPSSDISGPTGSGK